MWMILQRKKEGEETGREGGRGRKRKRKRGKKEGVSERGRKRGRQGERKRGRERTYFIIKELRIDHAGPSSILPFIIKNITVYQSISNFFRGKLRLLFVLLSYLDEMTNL